MMSQLARTLLFLVLIVPAAGAQAADTVKWFVSHFPPGYIRVGADTGTGHMDQSLAFLQRALKEFDHETVEGPLTRLFDSMKRRDGVCSNGVFRTKERQQFAVFSKPFIWIVANRLIVGEGKMSKVAPHLDGDGAVNVPSLLADESVTYGYGKSRSYAPKIDAALKRLGESPRGHAAIHSEALLRMIAGGRFDVTIAYPAEASYHLKRLGLRPTLTYLPMSGVARYFPVRIGCSKGEIGRGVVDKVNRLIDEAGDYPEWYAFYERRLSSDVVQELRAYVPGAPED